MLRHREFDLERAKACLNEYGSSKRAAQEMQLQQYQFCNAFRIKTGTNPSKYPLMVIKECGRGVIVTPKQISRHLRKCGIDSMEQDGGRFEEEIRSALRKPNGHREQPKVNGNFMHSGPTGGNGANGMHYGGVRGTEYTHESPVTIVARGKSVTLTPKNIKNYLRVYGLDFMGEEYYRHLEIEVRTALRKIDGQNGGRIATGKDMRFSFRKTDCGYAIAHLTVSQSPFDLSRLLPEDGLTSQRDELPEYARWPFNVVCVYGKRRR